MRRVVLESPYHASSQDEFDANCAYTRACLRDSLQRNEAPLASHITYARFGALDDGLPHDRARGISAGHAWIDVAEALVVYTDRGISKGMQAGINAANVRGVPVEFRKLNGGAG